MFILGNMMENSKTLLNSQPLTCNTHFHHQYNKQKGDIYYYFYFRQRYSWSMNETKM